MDKHYNVKTLGVYHGYSISKDNIWRELALNVKLVYKLLNANVEIWNSVGKHYLQNLDSKHNIRYFLYTCSFLPNMNYSSVMSTFLCSNSMQLKLVLSKLCVYFHY